MGKGRKKGRLMSFLNLVVPFVGPLAFEIANSVTGDWTNLSNEFYLSTGKLVTILIGVAYIIVMGTLMWYNGQEKKSIECLESQVSELQKKTAVYKKSNETLCTLLAYMDEKIKSQIEFLKTNGKLDVRELNINSASTTIAKVIHQNIIEKNGQDTKVTVNIYSRFKDAGSEYSIMIAHEGHASQPSVFGVQKIISVDKKKNRYSDKILLSDSPDYRIFLTKREVAKAFSLREDKCKYNQYLGIPIRKMGGINIALIEIVVHGETTIWEAKDDAVQFAANYCEVLKEYILLMDRIYEQGETIASKIDGGGA